jgi:hypothetical protein
LFRAGGTVSMTTLANEHRTDLQSGFWHLNGPGMRPSSVCSTEGFQGTDHGPFIGTFLEHIGSHPKISSVRGNWLQHRLRPCPPGGGPIHAGMRCTGRSSAIAPGHCASARHAIDPIPFRHSGLSESEQAAKCIRPRPEQDTTATTRTSSTYPTSSRMIQGSTIHTMRHGALF